METNVIINCDCMEGLKKTPSDSVDLVVTSPPYNKGNGQPLSKKGNHIWGKFKIEYDSYGDDMSEEDYSKWQIELLNELYRIIKPNGSVFYNHKVRLRNRCASFPKFAIESNLKLYQMIVWDRCCCCNVRNDYLFPVTELVFWLVKGNPKIFKENAKHKSEIWRISPEKCSKHPAPFPIELATNCINLTTQKGDLVLDPFMGSGTTAIAAKGLCRKYIGFELSPNYCKMANDRLCGIKRFSDNMYQGSLF